jgi:myo-inositol 2-dehydrogenase / D-chiro-inositol 1-dehydrogenase
VSERSEMRPDRRSFLASSAAASGILILKPETVFGTQANSAVEVGIIGCGGRGNYIGNFFVEHAGARVVALADAFRDRLEPAAAKFKVDPSRTYAGLEGYKALVASKLDGVVVETPPYYHPEQVAAGIAAGKHVFCAKPVAVDVPGCKSIAQSGRDAESRKLSLWVDFQTRARPVFQEAAERVHRGEIGKPVMGHVYYHTGRLRPQAKPTDTVDQARLRNWLFDKALSGDVIVEQHIHVLDVANWYLQSPPVKAWGTGGRKARLDTGDNGDHFLVTFWYPNDVRVDFSSAQFLKGYHDMCIRVYGTAGTVDSHYNSYVRIAGDTNWNGCEKDDTFAQGAITNVKDFVESIKNGKPINNAATGSVSTLTPILGRMAAYRGSAVTWEEMMGANEKLVARLKI